MPYLVSCLPGLRRAAPFLAVLCWLGSTRSAHSQATALETRRDIATQGSVALPPAVEAAAPSGETAAVTSGRAGVNRDFGEQEILQRRAHVEPWSATADFQIFRTDNAALAPSHGRDDWYIRYGASIGYANRIRGPLFVDFGLQQYFFRYQKNNPLDFDLTRATAGFVWQSPWLAESAFFARYRFERITEPGFGSSLLTNHVAELGVEKVWKISRGQRLTAELETDLPLDTDPKSGRRAEYSLTLAYSLRLTERLTAGLSYRGSYYDYWQIDRHDWNQIVSLDATYDFTDWLRAGVTASYTNNDSNLTFGNYTNLVCGGIFSLRLAF